MQLANGGLVVIAANVLSVRECIPCSDVFIRPCLIMWNTKLSCGMKTKVASFLCHIFVISQENFRKIISVYVLPSSTNNKSIINTCKDSRIFSCYDHLCVCA